MRRLSRAGRTRGRRARRPVLIRGETGSGKGVLARWLHDNGPRAVPGVRRPQLRGPLARAAGERAVRPPEGRVHRRGRGEAGPDGARPPRDAVPRRDRRRRPAGAGEAAEGRRGDALPAARRRARPPGRVPADRGHAPRSRRLVAEGRFREDLLLPDPRRRAARAAAARARPRRDPARARVHRADRGSTSDAPSVRLSEAAEQAAARTTPGRATCASCATCSSTRRSC